jgi:hypothetical protein
LRAVRRFISVVFMGIRGGWLLVAARRSGECSMKCVKVV